MTLGLYILFLTIITTAHCQSSSYHEPIVSIGWMSTETPKVPLCEWNVVVQTGKAHDSATKSVVILQIFENETPTNSFVLGNIGGGIFNSSQLAMFSLKFGCITPTKIKVQLNRDDSWLLDRIELQRTDDVIRTYDFTCNCWFHHYDSRLMDGKVIGPYIGQSSSPTLEPDTNEYLCEWDVKVQTSNIPNSGTKNIVILQIFENETPTSSYALGENGIHIFGSGFLTTIHLKFDCITPTKIKLQLDGSNGWNMDWVALQRKDDASKKYVFTCKCWFDDSSYQIIHGKLSFSSRVETVKTRTQLLLVS